MDSNFTNNKKFQAEFKRLLKMVTPSKEVHENYLIDVELFIDEHNLFSSLAKSAGKGPAIKKLKIVPSQVFNRNYLIAYADNGWFKSLAPHFNAVATPSIMSFDLQSPPLVVLPESAARLRNKYFLSILEHEFVHVNQAILENFPSSDQFSDAPFHSLVNYTLAEYQAYYIQYFHFPKPYLQEVDTSKYSLQDWSILQGYTQALETLVLAIYQGQISALHVENMLKAMPDQLPSGFKQMGLQERYGQFYAKMLPRYLALAVTKSLPQTPPPPKNKGFRALTRWISENLDS